MIKVDSRKTLRSITRDFMKANRGRNMILILAIIMTTVMFTALFTAFTSVVKSKQQQEMRRTMDASHITVQDLTQTQFEEVKHFEKIDRYGYTIFMATAENKELDQSMTEIRYADEFGAESYMCKPAKGRMPQAYDEIALSTITMELLGVPKELGSKVILEYTLSGVKQSHEFVLSGYWKGDPLFLAQEVWVSKSFCKENVKQATVESLSAGDLEGSYNLSLWLENVFNLNQYEKEIGERYKISQTAARVSVNPAVNLFEGDAIPYNSIVLLLLIIFISGYLIIYNVFYISITRDIRTYGLLKNIGTTGTQLKQIVRSQAWILSCVGIPVGLFIGYLVGNIMTPYLLVEGIGAKVEVVLNTHPLIFVTAALFSLFTIFMGSMQPCRIVAGISPVEAVRMTENDLETRSGKTGKITPAAMAAGHMRRTWKKTILVVISLALPIVVLNATYTIIKGFQFDNYINSFISCDFNISGLASTGTASELKGVTQEVISEVMKHPDTLSTALVYDSESKHELSETGYKNLSNIIQSAQDVDFLDTYAAGIERQFLDKREVISHVLGMNKAAFDKLSMIEGEADYAAFSSGEYVIMGNQDQGLGQYYNTGDQVELSFENGSSKYYTVMGIVDIPYDLGYRFGTGNWFDYTFILPETEYISMEGNEHAMLAGVDVKEGRDQSYEKWLADYIESSEKTLYVESKLTILDECKAFVRKYYVIMSILCTVLFLIGLLNLFNTSSVTMMARRKELSILEAVGMTKKQSSRMLVTEGMITLGMAVLLADTLGTAIAGPMIKETVGKTFFYMGEMTILPSIVIFPLMAVIAIAVPIYNFKQMQKETIMERLRNE